MNIVGFAGQMQNGKDTAADYMFEKIKSKWADVERASFADNVQRIFCETFNVDRSFVEEWKTKSEVPEGFDSPVRQGLQQIGDGFRKIQGSIWIELAFRNRVRSAIFSDVTSQGCKPIIGKQFSGNSAHKSSIPLVYLLEIFGSKIVSTPTSIAFRTTKVLSSLN